MNNLSSTSFSNERLSDITFSHRKLILEGNCDKAPGQIIKQYIYELAEYTIETSSGD